MLVRFLSPAILLLFCTLAAAQDKPVPPGEAAAKFKLPPGFSATLFAGEPDVVQPIAFTFDDRGRLWVVECHTYPNWDGERRDRVLILEDTDGDGKHDKRTVFLDDGKNLSGIEYGFGGIWLTAVPNLLFVPDKDKDDKPDGPPVVKLDGWDLKARHNVVNGITWAPDGWLWGLNGILSNSSVGKPGTPADQRMKMNCGVWRYHPVTEKIEAVAHGTTNPWGLDFDEYGEAFITNCVIKHAFHVVPGAHFERMFGQDINPRTYQLIPSIADHIHWGGGHWTESRSGAAHDAPGGGHAHSGCMIYLGDNFPEKYRGRLFTCNIHGNRVNQDRLERHGSSYVAKHEPDFLMANDPWFRGLAVKYGPDGGVYVADWTDTGECHNYEVADRTNGRIFKVTYGEVKAFPYDLSGLPSFELVNLCEARNAWRAAHARRILQERSAAGDLDAVAARGLRSSIPGTVNVRIRLQYLWGTHAANLLTEDDFNKLLKDRDHLVRAWSVRLLQDDATLTGKMASALCDVASSKSPSVRRALASLAKNHEALARPLLSVLAQQQENADDPYLPFLIWYAIEANLDQFDDKVETDLPEIKISLVRELLSRRLTEPSEPKAAEHLNVLLKVIADHADDAELQRDLVRGVFASLDGQKNLQLPSNWRTAYQVLSTHEDAAVRDIAMRLALVFGDETAITELFALVLNKQADSGRRASAITSLSQGKVARLTPALFELLDDTQVRTTAISALPAFADPKTPNVLLEKYNSFDPDAKREAIATLVARPDWAKVLLDAVERKQLSKIDFTAYHWQQLALLKDKSILERVEKLFGNVRPTKADRLAQIDQWKQKLPDAVLAKGNATHGRAIFNKSCAACHKLFNEGGAIGPELTGAQRANLDYVLTNVLDPSAVVGRDYQMQVIVTKDGRVLTGIIKAETDAVLTLQTSTALLKLAKSDIEERNGTNQSMMPEGLIQQFTFEEFRDLLAYLRSPRQVDAKE
jgi:putative membrane-bound dehydrogenase-like protein